MSVQVESLTKLYGDQAAVDHISFSVAKGQVLGFLGPNGAGKSTTMKILTGFIPQTSGSANVAGFDVNADTMAVRKATGYLPENNPLYLEMYVKEYLFFIGRLHGVQNLKKRVKEMVDMTGLGREQHKKIGQLSKGYRQRVGLAQAMLHDPEVLILDEPTSGLDPNQLSEIRGLIKALGKEKTVIFSTHIMQEVQAVSDRVVIINKGKIVADDTTENLQHRMSGEALVIEFKEPVDAGLLRKIKGVKNVQVLNPNKFQLTASRDVREDLFRMANEKKLTLLTLQREQQGLEQIFWELTKDRS